MKILFLFHIYKDMHEMLVKRISEVLNNHNYSVDYELQESVAYDCILVFNRKVLKNMMKYCGKDNHRSCIYFVCRI